MEKLLKHNSSYTFEQTKFFKNIATGSVRLAEMTYNLKITASKRQPVYINDTYTTTFPYIFTDDGRIFNENNIHRSTEIINE